MNIGINDDEKNKRIEKLIKEELEIIERIKDKLKKEINETDFILTESKIDEMYSLVEENIENYFKVRKEEYELWHLEKLNVKEENKRNFFKNLLKDSFKELEIFVKINNNPILNPYFNDKYILFKGNEGTLIAFLIENFSRFNGIESEFEIYITRKKLEELIKIYEVEENFIEKLEKNNLLIINRYNKNNLSIKLKDSSYYTNDNEANIRKYILASYNLKINNKIKSEIIKYNNDKKELDKKPFLESVDEDIKI